MSPLEHVREICLALPEVTERLSHGAPTFFVGKSFVMFHDDHHGDGRLALWVAAPPGVQEEMLAEDPAVFFRPPYVGHRGWLGMRLDRELEWEVVREVCIDGWRTVAPKRLLRERPE